MSWLRRRNATARPSEVPARPALGHASSGRPPGRHDAVRKPVVWLPALAMTMVPLAWMVTFGSWRLFDAEVFGQFYDAQARSLLAGQWDVPPGAIEDEAFVRDGRSYGYFGPVPALLHLLPAMVAPAADGCWSRLSVLLAAALSLYSADRLFRSARAAVRPQIADTVTNEGSDRRSGPDRRAELRARDVRIVYLLTVALGSTLVFIASRSYVFHEAAAWGAALALACFDQTVRYLSVGRFRNLAAACTFALLAFFSRGTTGIGALTAMALLAAHLAYGAARGRKVDTYRPPETGKVGPRPPRGADVRSFGHAAAAAGTVAAAVALFAAINFAKFRTPFNPTPLRLHTLFRGDPVRAERLGGTVVDARNVPTTAAAYFSPARVEFSRAFPWVYPTWNAEVYPGARLDIVEPYAAVTATAPGLLLLALAGMGIGCRRRLAWGRPTAAIPLCGALAGAATVLAADAVTQRYQHDFFPLLVLAGSFGAQVLLADANTALPPGRRPNRARSIVGKAVTLLLLYGVWANLAIAIVYQRIIIWGVPLEYAGRFRDARTSLNAALGLVPAGTSGGRETLPGYDRRWTVSMRGDGR